MCLRMDKLEAGAGHHLVRSSRNGRLLGQYLVVTILTAFSPIFYMCGIWGLEETCVRQQSSCLATRSV